jgi:hypothetical protein
MSQVITVNVTQNDIDSGTRGAITYCPVALAMSRALGAGVVTNGYQWSFGDRFVWHLPEVARYWIGDYDNYRRVGPISFEISAPDDWCVGCGRTVVGPHSHLSSTGIDRTHDVPPGGLDVGEIS